MPMVFTASLPPSPYSKVRLFALSLFCCNWLTLTVKGPVIIYDRGGAGSNNFLRKIFLWPTRCVEKKIAAYSKNFSMPTLTGRNKHVLL